MGVNMKQKKFKHYLIWNESYWLLFNMKTIKILLLTFLSFLREFTGHPEEEIQAALTQLVQKKWLSVNDPPH